MRSSVAMYTVDDRDELRTLDAFPQSDPGSPRPCVFADDSATTLLAYVCFSPVDWTSGENLPDEPDELVALVSFARCRELRFGGPNDEALAAHPLYPRGLRHYEAYEVLNSSWVRALEVSNRIHPRHDARAFAKLRHYVFTFHDSMFECVAESVSWVRERGTPVSLAAARMAPPRTPG